MIVVSDVAVADVQLIVPELNVTVTWSAPENPLPVKVIVVPDAAAFIAAGVMAVIAGVVKL